MTPQQALARLQGQCSKAEYCTGQIRKKLLNWSERNRVVGKEPFSDAQIESVMNSLLEEKYVDDTRFARAYVRDKARFSKWGRVKIAYNLKMLGVSKEIVGKALEENADLFSDELLEELVIKKWNSLGDKVAPAAKKEKVLRFALGRGFGYDQILPIIKRLG